MKKTYIEPAMEVIKVNVTNIIAASLAIYDTEVDTSAEDGQLSRESFSNSNVWEQEW